MSRFVGCMGTAEQRFWKKVVKSDSCWNWTGSLTGRGYGYFKAYHDRNPVSAHRFAYEITKGKIPEGLTIDHLCNNKVCVNPEHLSAVTNKENNLRGNSAAARNSRKTHCPRGHEYSHVVRGQRKCRICDNARRRKIHVSL